MPKTILAGLALAVVLCGVALGVMPDVRPTPQMRDFVGDPTAHVRYFVPNDPLYPQQWHLNNAGAYPHANVNPAWAANLTGSGVIIGIVDDGLETFHPDLAPNYVPADSWDFGQNDAIPNPVYSSDNHGTSVSGVAAARGGNALGVTGAAPEAGLAGLRIDFNNQTAAMFANATLYHSSGTNTNISVKNHSYGIGAAFIPTTLEVAALRTSTAAGTTHCVAAGNERSYHGAYYYDENGNGSFDPDIDHAVDADSNKKHNQSISETITVAALGADGLFTWYSNWGANVFVTAPSNGALGLGITTTDRVGAGGYDATSDYTNGFGGTSSASPLVAGIMALGIQANPAMDQRMAKHLLVRTSTIVHPTDATVTSDGGWKTNAAGNRFNQNYGFGLVNAGAFTTEAALWTGVSPLVTESTGTVLVNEAIIGPGGNLRNFMLHTPGQLEEVEVHLDIDHTWRGDLTAYLTSPAGTTSRLFLDNGADSFDLIDWTFVTNAFWGENPVGAWTIQIFDTFASLDDGWWNSFAVTARTGHLVPEPATLALLALGAALALRRRAR